ncbi:hypothetical protein D9758_000356 [Tetrapyrgos nigripes]|uniref:RNase III domain-containing protein n=1 Tax=Tetrapyrgos nigripes TaxID=182062 RepID=A0A8H5H0K6_9AGAR|nr:hypothetical protein D9758_000356 [Tetrapyrgos nigripes]
MSMYKPLQHKLSLYISSSAFKPFDLPELTPASWETMQTDRTECSRLEFLGDALINTFVAESIYKYLKQGDSGVYSAARSALTSNQTMGEVMRRSGYSNAQGSVSKCEADALETIIGSLFKEKGPEAVKQWLEINYVPLVQQSPFAHLELDESKEKKTTKAIDNHSHSPYVYCHRAKLCLINSPERLVAKSLRLRTPKPFISSPLSDRLASRRKTKPIRPSSMLFGSGASPIDLTNDSEWEDEDSVELLPPNLPSMDTITRAARVQSSTGHQQENKASAAQLIVAIPSTSAGFPSREAIAVSCSSSGTSISNPIILD